MANTANTTTTTYSNNFDFQDFYNKTNRIPVRLQVKLGIQLIERAAQRLGKSERDLRDLLETYAEGCSDVDKTIKERRDRQETAGREELTVSTDATSSAEGGKVALADHEVSFK